MRDTDRLALSLPPSLAFPHPPSSHPHPLSAPPSLLAPSRPYSISAERGAGEVFQMLHELYSDFDRCKHATLQQMQTRDA